MKSVLFFLSQYKVLTILAMSGYSHILIIDPDIIELGNVSRQFLFSKEDIGKPKVNVARDKILYRVPGIDLKPICQQIQDVSEETLQQCDVFLGCLDNLEARECVNQVALRLGKVYIDGGSTGLGGQVQLIIPSVCFWIGLVF